MLKSILEKILAIFARRVIQRYQPIVIGITGSVGKTSTREAIAVVLRKRFQIRTPEKNYNNEIGLPLTILGIRHPGKSILGWVLGLCLAFFRAYGFRTEYTEVLILEYGIDRPGDMDVLVAIARPHIAVVTKIGNIPVHVEFFRDPFALADEKAKLVKAIPRDGYAVLTRDDDAVFEMRRHAKFRSVSYGKALDADIRIMNSELRMKKDGVFGEVPDGISFKIQFKGKATPAFLPNTAGMPQLYSAGAAAAVGILMRMGIDEVLGALREYEPLPGRLRILRGIKDSLLIDDTYNAAPESMREALALLETLHGKRKIAVLGDMLEIGRYSEDAHRALGMQAGAFVDILLTVGPHARFIGEEVKAERPKKKARNTNEKVFSFANAISAGKMLQTLIRPGDVILIKGSQGMRMEKIVEEVMALREQAKKLLVRQENYWKK